MLEGAPRPYFSQDTGIPGMAGIPDQTAQSVGGERSREAEHQAFHLPIPENDPRTELLQDFQAKLNRWFDVFNPTLLSVDSVTEETEIRTHAYSGFGINLELTQRGYKIQEGEEGKIIRSQEYHIPFAARSGNTEYPGIPRIWVEAATVYSKTRPVTVRERGFYIQIYTPEDNVVQFHDPYNNRPFYGLRAGIREKPQSDIRYHIPYEFFVDVCYTDDIVNPEFDTRRGIVIDRAAFFEAEVPMPGMNPPAVRREIHVDRGEDKDSLLLRGSDDEYFTLLPGDIDVHAKALIDFADSLIPHITPQLPEPPTAGEQ